MSTGIEPDSALLEGAFHHEILLAVYMQAIRGRTASVPLKRWEKITAGTLGDALQISRAQ
jgi:hypothetical protein